jgi:predicted DsbA family dithiol-disulfide isomerase
MSETPLVVYADYVCPFCYLGRVSLRGFLADASDPPAVEWRAFDLRGHKRDADGEIDHTVDDGKDDAYFEQARENVERLRDRYDAEMRMDFDRSVDSWNAQQVALAVRERHPDRFESVHDAVFDALWREGRDIGDPAVLAEVADSAGLPSGFVAEVLADEAAETRLREAFTMAREAGVTAVPTFVYGEHAARGAVPPEHLSRLVGAEPTP